jgi:hypothetical protein
MDVDVKELERAKERVRQACLRHAGVHAVGLDAPSNTLIVYYSDDDHPDLEKARQDAARLASPFQVRFVRSPPAGLACL